MLINTTAEINCRNFRKKFRIIILCPVSQSEPDTEIYIISMMTDRCRKGGNMQEKQQKNIQMETAFCVRLLKMLLCSKVINQATYDKVIKRYNGKEAA